VRRAGPLARGHAWLLLAVLAYAAGFRLATLNRPFDYGDEATGSFYGIMARNYLRFPWAESHGMPIVSVGARPGVSPVWYADHSPLVPLVIAPVYKVFGFGAWQTRLPTALATLLSVLVLFVLVRRFGSTRSALTAAALFAAMPMTLYFGGQPEVTGMPLVLFALATVYSYLLFQREPSARAFAWLLACFALAGASDWPGFVLAPVLVAHFVATQPRRRWPWMIAFSLFAATVFALLYVYIKWAAALPWAWMIPLVKGRAAIGRTPFTARQWLQTARTFNVRRHSLPLLIAVTAWMAWRAVARRGQPGTQVAWLLLAWGAAHVAISRQGVYNHEWWWWPLTPGIAVGSALFIDGGLDALERRHPGRWPQTAVAAAIVLFASWTTFSAYTELYPREPPGPFTALELGRAIQIAAPGANDVAMLAFSGDDPEVWFYGDRPLRVDIWSVDDFTSRANGQYVDLVFSDLQDWPGPAAGLVFPAAVRPTSADLYAYLRARYPLEPLPPDLARKFDVFRLNGPAAGPAGREDPLRRR
jgi:Dolichyl-phosphate-mannose-protein mannosyltransferase